MAKQTKKTVHPHKPTAAEAFTPGKTLRMQPAKSARKRKSKAAATVVVVQEVNPINGFVSFLREHAIVGLAIGFAIATQVQIVVKQLITSFIDPLFGLVLNGEKLSSQSTSVHWHGRTQVFTWGAFIYILIDFLFVLAVLYGVIKFFRLDKLDVPKDKKK